jgi:transcriptional regulator with XRE-family HTH domain
MPRARKAATISKKGIGDRVRSLRIRQGLTQVELAKKIGVKQSNVSELERGVRGLSIQQLVKLSKVLATSTDEILLGGVATETRNPKLSLKILRRVHRIQELPPEKQRAVLQILDAILERQDRNNGSG